MTHREQIIVDTCKQGPWPWDIVDKVFNAKNEKD